MQRPSDSPFAQRTDIAVLLLAWLIVLAAFAAAAHCKPGLPGSRNKRAPESTASRVREKVEPGRSTGLPGPRNKRAPESAGSRAREKVEPGRSTGLPGPRQGEPGRSDTPSLEAVDKYGYVIEQIARARYPSATIVEGFEGTVWVRYTDSRPEWRFTLTFRPKRSEALRDCEAWMDRVERALKKNRKHGC
jgi:hypothetical protein